MAKKQGLGNKFSSIFDEAPLSAEQSEGVVTLKIGEIEPNREQPRKNFDIEALNALADSIREHGVIQPLTVRQLDNGAYQLVAGERRWRASKIAGLSEVPVRIMELSDEQAAQIALIENLQREDLDPIEEANGYRDLMERFNLTQDEVAAKVGKARSTVANTLRLLDLPDGIRLMVQMSQLSTGHCKALLGLEDEDLQTSFARTIFERGLSVRAAEKLVAETTAQAKAKPRKTSKPQFYKEAEVWLGGFSGCPVKISPNSKGTVTVKIDCKDEQELKNLLKKMQGE